MADEAAWRADPVVLQRTQREQARLLDVLHGKLKAAKALAREARAQQGLLLDQADDLQQTATHEAFGRAPLDLANPALSTQANNVSDRMPVLRADLVHFLVTVSCWLNSYSCVFWDRLSL